MRRLAIAHPQVRFVFASALSASFDWPACGEGAQGLKARLRQALGAAFAENALALDASREGVGLSGLIGLPTASKSNALSQYFYVNHRAVRDKALHGALRAAYADYLPSERYPAAALFLACDPHLVDVNVHPAKAEVRFRDAGLVRGLIVGAVRQRLGEALHQASSAGGTGMIAAARSPEFSPRASRQSWDWRASPAAPSGFTEAAQARFEGFAPSSRDLGAEPAPADSSAPLGAAQAQLHETYIVAQTQDGVVIVDQHAAHERIVYEKLKRQRAAQGVERQILLSPVVVDFDEDSAARLVAEAPALERLGLAIEAFGPGAVLLREAPALLAQGDMAALLRDLADDLAAEDGLEALERRLDHRLATIACHHSVRSGRKLKPEEMNALLREMERTPGAGQCNHGRPTYVELKLNDIERLFGRR